MKPESWDRRPEAAAPDGPPVSLGRLPPGTGQTGQLPAAPAFQQGQHQGHGVPVAGVRCTGTVAGHGQWVPVSFLEVTSQLYSLKPEGVPMLGA